MTEVDSDEDLTKELQPLAYHVSDRRKVLREALRALKGKRLDAMIPPGLKSWDRSRLEYACVEILEDVDDETLLAILDGRVSTAGVAAVEQAPSPMEVAGLKTKKKLKKKLIKSVDSNDVVEDEPKKKKKKKVTVVNETDKNEDKLTKLKKKKKLLKAKAKEKVKKKKKAAAAAATEDPAAPAPHKSLMELLELEYRAKAIKALLRSQGQTVPDIPLNIDENSNSNETVNVNTKQVEQSTAAVKSPLQVNGSIEPVSNMVTAATSSQKPEIKTVKPTAKARSLKLLKEGKSSDTAVSDPPKVNPIKDEVSKKIAKHSPIKAPPEEKPKKAVIDLIDEALNTSFSEEASVATALNNDAIKPLPVIAEACAQKNIDGEALRNKLLQKYQNQKLRKKKKKPKAPDQDQEDILDLHPQELSLTDEDQAAGQNAASCTENDTSEYSESEPDESNPDTSLKVQTSPPQNKDVVENAKSTEDEELNYDEDSLDEVLVSTDKIQTDEVSQSENMELDNTEDSNSICKTEESLGKKSNEPDGDDTQMSGGENTRDAPLSENSRSEMFSETTRDDVFEGTSGNSAFTQSSKRKITFRIDPARIGALEEQGAEEEARKAEERKLDDVENDDLEEEKEVEEGEIDSNEEEGFDEEKKPLESSPPKGDKRRDLRDFLNRKHINEHSSSDDDTDESQDSSYNVRRTSYRKTSGTDRDCGTYSPKRSDKSDKNEPAPKRPSSPVEFITQFSDMEPISDDSDHSGSRSPKVTTKRNSSNSDAKNITVQGCAEKPSGTNDKLTIITNSRDKEEDQVKDVSNATNEDSQESVASDTPSKSSIVEKADSASGGEEDEDELPKPVTWYERWAQSHGMQKVAKTNKIHKKVRTKMKKDVSAKKKPIDLPKDEPSIEAEPIIGSIEEYEKLFGKKVVNSEPADQSDDKDLDKSAVEASNQVDNNDDDDADDLWGDILGGS